MEKSKALTIYKVFLVVISVLTFGLGAFFILEDCRIYFGNNGVYNTSIVGKYLLQILPVFIAYVIACVTGYVFYKLSESDKKKSFFPMGNKTKYKNLIAQLPKDFSSIEEKEAKGLILQKKTRLAYTIVLGVILAICAGISIYYLLVVLDLHQDTDMNSQIRNMFIHLLPWLIISCFFGIIYLYMMDLSYVRSFDLAKKLLAKYRQEKAPAKKDNLLTINIARGVIFAVAVTFIIIGVLQGDNQDVLKKAVNICTECIGLG